jgi:hypothetical protein
MSHATAKHRTGQALADVAFVDAGMIGRVKHAEREWSQSISIPRRGRYFIPRQKRHDLFPWPARAFAVAYAAFIVFCIFK